MFQRLQARMPLDHYIFSMPAGLPIDRFVHYAEIVANKVVPAFVQDMDHRPETRP
jgi:hypothetical protein